MNDTPLPLISVLIPAYNHERYVGECVRSVMAQDWPRMELLIVDDGSKDATWARINELSAEASASGRFERVEIATQENRGTCETLNRLCGMAGGDVVAIIASDDKYLPGAFAALMKPMMSDPSVGVVVGQNGFMDGEGRDCFWDCNQNIVYDASRADCHTFNEHLRRLSDIEDNGGGFGTYGNLLRCNHIANGYLIRRSFLERVLPFRREAPLEDHWLHLQLSKICRYRAVPEMTFRYRWHAGNTIRQSGRMIALRYRTLKWEERFVSSPENVSWADQFQRATRETRVKFSLGRLLSCEKRATLEEKLRVLRVFGREVVLRRKSRLTGMQLRVLAVVHVYYPERWDELSSCLRNIDDPTDLVITYCDEFAVARARREFPSARFVRCANVGYDIWPFIAALGGVDLGQYDCIVKLHTKRDLPEGLGARPFNGFCVDGSRWREQLLDFVRTREKWSMAKRRLSDPRVGMVAGRWVIVGENSANYVAGTMFAAKPVALKAFLDKSRSQSDFAPADGEHSGSLAHVCERELGQGVASAGLRIAGYDGREVRFRIARAFRRLWAFCYRSKLTSSGRRVIKIAKIPVYRSRKGAGNV